jgi:hypothetical protein
MERAKQITNDKKLDPILDHIYRNGMGNPIILPSAPTNDEMKGNSWGIHGSDIYIKHANGVLIKLSGTVIP